MITKSSLFVIALIVALAEGNGISSRNPFMRQEAARECTKTGYMCETCEHIVFCFKLPNGEWLKEDAGFCTDGKTCQDTSGTCSSEPDFECDPTLNKYQFQCNQFGMFPHAFDCKKYHMCTLGPDGETPIKEPVYLECPEGYGYDPLTSLCRIKVKNDKCHNPLVKPCKGVGESGPIPGNPSLYFTCLPTIVGNDKINFPQMFHCDGNMEYIDKRCQDPTPSGLDNDGKCTGSGNFYDPDDCVKYIECTGNGSTPISRSCSTGYRFEPRTKNCVLFSCKYA